jgi:hypothetical protein
MQMRGTLVQEEDARRSVEYTRERQSLLLRQMFEASAIGKPFACSRIMNRDPRRLTAFKIMKWCIFRCTNRGPTQLLEMLKFEAQCPTGARTRSKSQPSDREAAPRKNLILQIPDLQA